VFCQGDLFSHLRFSPILRRQILREAETASRIPGSGGGVRIRETKTARPATETGSAGVWSGVFGTGTYRSLLTVLSRQSVTGFDGNRNPRIRSWEPHGRCVCGCSESGTGTWLLPRKNHRAEAVLQGVRTDVFNVPRRSDRKTAYGLQLTADSRKRHAGGVPLRHPARIRRKPEFGWRLTRPEPSR
jgi:hypothetical protein